MSAHINIVNSTAALVPVDDVKVHPDNPRRGDIKQIAQSIEANGFYGALIVQKSTGHVLAGNHRLQAAIALGMKKVPVQYVDVDDTTADRILLADNRTADLASYDDADLARVLSDLAIGQTLTGTGWTNDDLDDLLAILERDTPPGALDMEEITEEMRQAAGQPRLVIDTTTEMIERFRKLEGDTDHDKLESIMPPVEGEAGE